MNTNTTTGGKADQQNAVFTAADKIVIDPALSKDQKTEALEVLEQDARQMQAASDEGMAGGEPNNLRKVLVAKDKLELPPVEQAYETVLKDLSGKLATDVAGDTRALLGQAIAALVAVRESPALKKPAAVSSLDKNGNPLPGSPEEIDAEIALEKLDPGA